MNIEDKEFDLYEVVDSLSRWSKHYMGEVARGEKVALAIEKIDKAIEEACNARAIEELSLHATEWVEINDDGTINPRVVYDRIEELKAERGES